VRALAYAEHNCLDPVNVFSAPPLTPVVKKLLIALFAAFVLELLLQNFLGIAIVRLLALDPIHIGPKTAFELFSYVLIDDLHTPFSLVIGLLFMWLIMSPFEAAFGRKHTLELIAAGTLGGSLAAIALGQIAPIPGYLFAGSHTIAYAGMVAMAQVMGSGRRMLLFGAIPLTSQQLMLVLAGLSFLNYLVTKDHIGLAGSLGAMGAGVAYVKYMARAPRPVAPKRPNATRFRVVRGGGGRSNDDDDRPKWLN